MNTCEKNDHYYYFLFIQRYRTSYSEGTATPPYLSYFCKKNTFSLIFQYSRFSRIFSYFFDDFSKSHRYAATLRIARYVAFWRQAATPTATAIFILDSLNACVGRRSVDICNTNDLNDCDKH